jgi:hypothetical protein
VRERDRGDPDRRLAQFKQVRMRFDATRLSDRERRMIDELVTARHAPLARSVRRYLIIDGSRWDLVDENRPFATTVPMPPGHLLRPWPCRPAGVDGCGPAGRG